MVACMVPCEEDQPRGTKRCGERGWAGRQGMFNGGRGGRAGDKCPCKTTIARAPWPVHKRPPDARGDAVEPTADTPEARCSGRYKPRGCHAQSPCPDRTCLCASTGLPSNAAASTAGPGSSDRLSAPCTGWGRGWRRPPPQPPAAGKSSTLPRGEAPLPWRLKALGLPE